MAFQPADGEWKSEYYPTAASTQYNVGDLVYDNATNVVPSTTSSLLQVGIVDQLKASSDSTTNKIKVLVPKSAQCTMYGDVGSGSPAAGDVGKNCDLATVSTVAWGTNTHHQLTIAGYISATRGIFKLNSQQGYLNAS